MSAPLLIAVDGGGTGCRVAVGTATQGVLAEARGGPSNVSTNFEHAIANITETVTRALADAGRALADMEQATAHLGLAGADLKQIQQRTAEHLPFGRTVVSGDRQTTVAGVLGAQDGYVVALGTGTIIARQHAGTIRTVSGWGFQLSDHASGAWLGRALLVRVLEAEEAMATHSPLTRRVAADMGGVKGVFDFATTATPADYAHHAPAIFAAAETEDATALELLRSGARNIENGLTALGFTPGDVLSLAGGVGPHFASYLDPDFTRTLREPLGNALQGAFALARQAAKPTS